MRRVLPFIILVTMCGTSAYATPPEDTITIGASLALTGKLAFSGTATQRGLQLGIERINADGGIDGQKLALLVDDNAGEPKKAVDGVSKLLNVDKVSVIFSSLSHITQAIKSIVQRSGKVMIYAASIGDIAAENPLAFRDWGDITEQVLVMGNAISQQKLPSIAIIAEQSEACVMGVKTLNEFFKGAKISVVSEEFFNPGETDFRTLLLKAGTKKPDGFAFCAWRDSGLIMKQLQTTPVASTPTFHFLAPFLPDNDTAEIRKLYEENRAQTAWSGAVPDSAPTGNGEAFYKEYSTKFHEAPRIEASFAYDDMQVLASALKKCKGISNPTCVATELQATKYDGAGGSLSFDAQRRSNRESFMMSVTNGNWQRLN